MFLLIKEALEDTLQARRMCKKLHARRSPVSYYLIGQILKELRLPNHQAVQKNANRLVLLHDYAGHFYLAQSYFLQNELSLAKTHILKFLEKHPYHPDASYLLAQIQVLLGQKHDAKQLLLELLGRSPRKKTWQILSDVVNVNTDFKEYETLFRRYYPNYQAQKLPYDLICHLSNAAQRGGCDEFALRLWRTQWELHNQVQTTDKPVQSTHRYTDESAAIALSAIKQCLDKAAIPFFLISGTLLGCIREGKLLGHDKDIDIGVWEAHTINVLADVIRGSGAFYILPTYSPDILVVRHVNGVTIDIFRHYREPDDYWHAGGKCCWHNSPFELAHHHFLGDEYLIPKDYETYLTENYGDDWRVPKIDFDSALDTPNMKILSRQKMLIYFYKKLFQDTLAQNLKNRIECAIRLL